MKNTVGIMMLVLGLDMTTRLIVLGLSDRLLSPARSALRFLLLLTTLYICKNSWAPRNGHLTSSDFSTTSNLSFSITGRHSRITGDLVASGGSYSSYVVFSVYFTVPACVCVHVSARTRVGVWLFPKTVQILPFDLMLSIGNQHSDPQQSAHIICF